MKEPLSPERRAELLASATRKKQQAAAAKAHALLQELTTKQFDELIGLQFTYTLTRDEYRAMFE